METLNLAHNLKSRGIWKNLEKSEEICKSLKESEEIWRKF